MDHRHRSRLSRRRLPTTSFAARDGVGVPAGCSRERGTPATARMAEAKLPGVAGGAMAAGAECAQGFDRPWCRRRRRRPSVDALPGGGPR